MKTDVGRKRVGNPVPGLLRFAFGCLVAGAAAAGFGDVFSWIGDGNGLCKWGAFGDPSNWVAGTNQTNGANLAGLIPGAGDELYAGRHGDSPYNARWYFDLGGSHHSLKCVNSPKLDWKRRYMSITNGTLEFVESLSARYLDVRICDGGVLKSGRSAVSDLGDSGTRMAVQVYGGGRFELYGKVTFYNYDTKVRPGGSFVFDSSDFQFNANNNNVSSHTGQGIYNEGDTEFPNGMTLCNYSKWSDPAYFLVKQISGRMTVGGNIARVKSTASPSGELMFSLAGGVFKAVKDVSFTGLYYVRTEENTVAELNVAEGATLDVTPFAFGENTSLSKTGPGRLVVSSLPAALRVESGTLRPTRPGPLPGVEFAPGSVLEFCVPGLELESLPNAAAMGFVVDMGNLGPGVTLVRSSDVSLLETIAAKISLPSGVKTLVKDGSLRLATDAADSFSSNGELDLSDPSGWRNATVPSGADVHVTGDSTIALIGPGSPQFRSVTVSDGAVLKVAPGTVLPEIAMSYSGKILFVPGEESVFTNGFDASAAANSLPVIEIPTNAAVDIGRGFVFKNVDLRLYGKITATNSVVFGGAAAGETAYFAMASDGGTVELKGKTGSAKRFVSPEQGGRVEVVRDILIRNTRFLPENNRSWGVSTDWASLQIGYQNPSDIPFTVTVDGCFMDIGYEVNSIGGGATVRCVNGGGLLRPLGYAHPGFHAKTEICGNGRIVLDGGSYFRFTKSDARKDSIKIETVKFMPADEGTEQLTLRGGSRFCAHQTFGNRKAVASFEDSYCDIPSLPRTSSDFLDVTDTRVWLTSVFNGLRSVKIADGSTLYLRATNDLWGVNWDRDVLVADVPFTGGGSLVVTNAASGNGFRATVVNGFNTVTGIATACPDVCGDDSTLLFADGANWAGTVVANGHVALTNVQNGAAARVSFNALRLDGTFPLRVWASTNDMVDVATASLDGDGCIKPVAMDGRSFEPGDTVPFGTYPAGAAFPLRTGRDWVMFATDTDNSGRVMLNLRYSPRGLVLSFR